MIKDEFFGLIDPRRDHIWEIKCNIAALEKELEKQKRELKKCVVEQEERNE